MSEPPPVPGGPPVIGGAPSAAPGWLPADLRTLGRGLVAYGIAGVVMAVVGLVLAGILVGRMNSVSDRVTPQLATLSETVDSTIAALDQASATSQSFGATLTTTGPALDSVASSIATIQPTLAAAGSSLSGIDIFGRKPFEAVGTLFTQVADQIATLGPRLTAVSSSLGANQSALASTAQSLDALSASLQKAKETLASGIIEQSISDLIRTTLVALILLVLFFALPGLGALVLGLWLLRRVVPSLERPAIIIVGS